MFKEVNSGLSFGVTSGIITTMSILVGLGTGTESKVIAITGVLIVAIADSLSDAFGVHMLKESEDEQSDDEIWKATVLTFLSKFLMTISFLVPLLLFPISTAMVVAAIWGILCLSLLSYYIARKTGENVVTGVLGHVGLALLVVAATRVLGNLVHSYFS